MAWGLVMCHRRTRLGCGRGRAGDPGVAERPGGLSSGGDSWSSFLPSTSAGSSGSGPRGSAGASGGQAQPPDPCGGQTEWQWSRKGSLRSPGSVVVGAGMSHTQELRSLKRRQPDWGGGGPGQALQAETAGRILGDKQEPDRLGGEGYCGRPPRSGRAETVRAWASARERPCEWPWRHSGGWVQTGGAEGWGSCPAHGQSLRFLPVSSRPSASLPEYLVTSLSPPRWLQMVKHLHAMQEMQI